MKKKIITKMILIAILIMFLLSSSVFALSFKVGINLNTKVIQKGGNVELTISIDNMNIGGEGMCVFMTQIEYDKNVFEPITNQNIQGLNGWTFTYSEDNGKILLENDDFVTNDSDLFKITMKLKEDIDIETTDIKLVNPQTSNNRQDIIGTTAITTIGIKKLSSEKYEITEDNKIKGIVADTTVDQFKNNIEGSNGIIVIDKNGQEISGSTKVGTGAKASTSSGDEYTLIVKGDINGDGIVDITDITQIILHRAKIESLGEIELLAGDVVSDGVVDITDISRMILFRAKIISSLEQE